MSIKFHSFWILIRSLVWGYWLGLLFVGRRVNRYFFRQTPLPSQPLLGLRRYQEGQERCVGCKICSLACPTQAIKISAAQFGTEPPYAETFTVDMNSCVSCRLCEWSCPTNAIILTSESMGSNTPPFLQKDALLEIGERWDLLHKNKKQEKTL